MSAKIASRVRFRNVGNVRDLTGLPGSPGWRPAAARTVENLDRVRRRGPRGA